MGKNKGGSAFPITNRPNESFTSAGMTLRDWFAGQALAGFCSIDSGTPEADAKMAYRIADAMLEARNG